MSANASVRAHGFRGGCHPRGSAQARTREPTAAMPRPNPAHRWGHMNSTRWPSTRYSTVADRKAQRQLVASGPATTIESRWLTFTSLGRPRQRRSTSHAAREASIALLMENAATSTGGCPARALNVAMGRPAATRSDSQREGGLTRSAPNTKPAAGQNSATLVGPGVSTRPSLQSPKLSPAKTTRPRDVRAVTGRLVHRPVTMSRTCSASAPAGGLEGIIQSRGRGVVSKVQLCRSLSEKIQRPAAWLPPLDAGTGGKPSASHGVGEWQDSSPLPYVETQAGSKPWL